MIRNILLTLSFALLLPSNILFGMRHVRRRMLPVCFGQIVLGVGFLGVAAAPNMYVACAAAAFSAIGGPMGDLMLMSVLQSDIPNEHLGRVFSLRFLISNLGASLGLLLAPALFTWFSAPAGIALCALILIVAGLAGLLKFGFAFPQGQASFSSLAMQPVRANLQSVPVTKCETSSAR